MCEIEWVVVIVVVVEEGLVSVKERKEEQRKQKCEKEVGVKMKFGGCGDTRFKLFLSFSLFCVEIYMCRFIFLQQTTL